MYFSGKLAADIVRLIGGVIDDEGVTVSVADTDGRVAASGDPRRTGTADCAARLAAAQNLSELEIRYDGEFEGALEGIAIPASVRGETAAVTLLSAPLAKVRRYAGIVKKMTEILILESVLSEEMDMELRARTRFLNEWIHGAPRMPLGVLINKGLQFNIDITSPRRLMLVSVIPRDSGADAARLQRAVDAAEKKIHESLLRHEEGSLVFRSENHLVCLLPSASDEKMLSVAVRLKAGAEKAEEVTLAVGIDAPAGDWRQMPAAFSCAEKALGACLRSPSRQPRLYESLNMEIFESELSDMTKLEFIRRIFRGCSPDEIAEYAAMLEAYYDCEGSVTKAAGRLLIHKNTLQYRLKKLAERTGYDPRSIKYSSLYYNAVHFYRDLGNIL